jgi:hypothetical protein
MGAGLQICVLWPCLQFKPFSGLFFVPLRRAEPLDESVDTGVTRRGCIDEADLAQFMPGVIILAGEALHLPLKLRQPHVTGDEVLEVAQVLPQTLLLFGGDLPWKDHLEMFLPVGRIPVHVLKGRVHLWPPSATGRA